MRRPHSLSTASEIGLAAIVVTLAALYVFGYVKLTRRIREISSPV
jgi:hypothetical protein